MLSSRSICRRVHIASKQSVVSLQLYAPLIFRRSVETRAGEGEGQKDDESGLETSFISELKRRGIDPAKGPEAVKPSAPAVDPFTATSTRTRAPPPSRADRGAAAAGELDGQRERSQAMVNEGLEGLIPRASQLVQLGGSFFLAFGPFILAVVLAFSAIYGVFGESFVHRGREGSGPPPYVDPERLLSESTVDPYVPFDRR